jgi:hypothetical protein
MMTTTRILALLLLLAACGKHESPPTKDKPADATDAVSEYKRKSMATEAKVQLNRLGKAAEAYAMEDHLDQTGKARPPGSVPIGKVGPTPEVGSCCKSGGTCAPDAAMWNDPLWQDLAFSVEDPSRYAYAYESTDGKTFTLTAVGDLDCNGKTSRYTVKGDCNATPCTLAKSEDSPLE